MPRQTEDTEARGLASGGAGRAVYDNSNIVECYPGIVSPLTFSIAQYACAHIYEDLARLLGVSASRAAAARPAFADLLARIDGRVYCNLGTWRRALALLPRYRMSRGYVESIMGLSEPLHPTLADRLQLPLSGGVAARLVDRARMLRAGAGLVWQAIWLRRTIIHFRRRVDSVLALDEQTIAALQMGDLAREYRRIESQLLNRWDAPLVNDLICIAAYAASRHLFAKWFGLAGAELHDESLIGQGDIVSAEPPQRIRAMAELARGEPELLEALGQGDFAALRRHAGLHTQISRYLTRFGDRCPGELKLESIPLTQDPQPLFAAILAASETAQRVPQTKSDLATRLTALCEGRPLRRRAAWSLLRYARSRVRDRETLRLERALIFGQTRRLFLALGAVFCRRGWLDDPRDVLTITVPEVLGAAEGALPGSALRGIAAERKRELAQAAQIPNPLERIARHSPAVGPEDQTARQGAGCSAGVTRGTAFVVNDQNIESIGNGAILVARHTDPGWIALFAAASAIVVERGGVLSHSAIVAREMGIPCVMALKGVTDWLATGDTIEVDGASGQVRRLDG